MKFYLLFAAVVFSLCMPLHSQSIVEKRSSNVSAQAGWQEFEPLSIDGYFNIVNRGITRLYCELNDRRFTLTTFPEEVRRGDFIYLIPVRDTVMIDIFAYLNPGFFEITKLRILPQGPTGAAADLIIADASGRLKENVDFALQLDLQNEGDANGDGATHEGDDQFVELVNTGGVSIDLNGWRIDIDSDVWHDFSSERIVEPGEALIVFGGGNPQGIQSEFELASKPGGFGLYYGIGSKTDVVRLVNDVDVEIDTASYNFTGDVGQSLTRFPEGEGLFVLHTDAVGSGRQLFSPGTNVAGNAQFSTSSSGGMRINEIHADPAADEQQFPEEIGLLQNAPNPFNGATRIRFTIPENRLFGTLVKLRIYNLLGQRVKTIVDGTLFPGDFQLIWNADDDAGRQVASGVYLMQLEIDGIRKARRIVLSR